MRTHKEKPISAKKDSQEELEAALTKRRSQKFILRLYVSGATPRSTRAIEKMQQICEEHLKDRCQLEIIDIYQHPEKARSEQVVAAPTLVKKLPPPLRKFIGDLSDSERILIGLEIKEDQIHQPDDSI